MGEYIKYKGEEIKIGTLENLYYATYQKFTDALKAGQLARLYDDAPEFYAKADSGFRFRFPFPDEDKLPLGDIGKQHYNRGVPVTISQADIPHYDTSTPFQDTFYNIEITQQKLVHRQSDGKLCLAIVCRDAVNGTSFRVEDEEAMKAILKQITQNHVLDEPDTIKKNYYRNVGLRILKGFRLEQPENKIRQRSLPNPVSPPVKKAQKRKGI